MICIGLYVSHTNVQLTPPTRRDTLSRQRCELGIRLYSIFGRPFVKRFALCYQTVVCLSCLSCSVLSVCLYVCECDIGVLWPNRWMCQDENWHAGKPRPWSHCVRWRPAPPPLNGDISPNFRPISVVVKWLDGSRCHLVKS